MFRGNRLNRTIVGLMLIGMLGSTALCGGANSEEGDYPYICVKGVLYANDVPLALVNEEILGVGDTISGVTVVSINSSSVQFDYQGKIFDQQVGDCKITRASVSDESDLEKTIPPVPEEKIAEALYDNIRDKVLGAKLGTLDTSSFIHLIAGMMGVAWIIVLLLYVYTSIAVQTIAKKTRTGNSWLAWIPIANVYLICRIAKKPGWWTLLIFFVPVVQIIIAVIVSMRITEVRNKSKWLGLLLLVPVVQIVVLGYVAFSKDADAVIVQEQSVQSEPKQ